MAQSPIPTFDLGRFDAVAIGSSTGAPEQLKTILRGLPADLPFPIFIAQHLPPRFTESFARDLDLASPLTVVHAEDGMPVYPGTVYLGRGRQHMRVKRLLGGHLKVEVNERPTELIYLPSADELLRSAAAVYGGKTLGVVMTGIGADGREGAAAIKAAGGAVLTQSQATCVVYGMPKACVEAGLSDAQLGPEGIQRALLQLSPNHRSAAG